MAFSMRVLKAAVAGVALAHSANGNGALRGSVQNLATFPRDDGSRNSVLTLEVPDHGVYGYTLLAQRHSGRFRTFVCERETPISENCGGPTLSASSSVCPADCHTRRGNSCFADWLGKRSCDASGHRGFWVRSDLGKKGDNQRADNYEYVYKSQGVVGYP